MKQDSVGWQNNYSCVVAKIYKFQSQQRSAVPKSQYAESEKNNIAISASQLNVAAEIDRNCLRAAYNMQRRLYLQNINCIIEHSA